MQLAISVNHLRSGHRQEMRDCGVLLGVNNPRVMGNRRVVSTRLYKLHSTNLHFQWPATHRRHGRCHDNRFLTGSAEDRQGRAGQARPAIDEWGRISILACLYEVWEAVQVIAGCCLAGAVC